MLNLTLSKEEYEQLNDAEKVAYVKVGDRYYLNGFWMYNLMFYHQILLEGVKLHLADMFFASLRDMFLGFQDYTSSAKLDELGDLPLSKQKQLLSAFNKVTSETLTEYVSSLENELETFTDTDIEVLKFIFEQFSDKNVEVESVGLFNEAMDSPIPASGALLEESISAFTSNLQQKIINIVRHSIVNDSNTKQLLEDIAANGNAFQGSLFGTSDNQNSALIDVAIQHISSTTQSALGSELFNSDIWQSVIDNKTTEICLSRNGNIYPSGEGPYPPAHYKCRSKRVPVVGKLLEQVQLPDSLIAFLDMQNDYTLNLLIGSDLAKALRAGKLNDENFSFSHAVKPLTFTEFADRIHKLVNQ